MSLPTKIDGLPPMILTQTEERLLRVLIDGRNHSRAELIEAVWQHRPPLTYSSCLSQAITCVRGKVLPHGYLVISDRDVGFSLIKDTRKFD